MPSCSDLTALARQCHPQVPSPLGICRRMQSSPSDSQEEAKLNFLISSRFRGFVSALLASAEATDVFSCCTAERAKPGEAEQKVFPPHSHWEENPELQRFPYYNLVMRHFCPSRGGGCLCGAVLSLQAAEKDAMERVGRQAWQRNLGASQGNWWLARLAQHLSS